MKNLLLTMCLLLFGFSAILAQKNNQLPDNSNTFLKDNYSNEKVENVKVDRNRDKVKGYKVKLSNNISVDFDGNGEVVEIESKTRIPDSALPQNIVDYVRKNYSQASIVEYEKDEDEIEVELDNGVELEFNLLGTLMEVDD